LASKANKIAYKYKCALVKVDTSSSACVDKTTPKNQAGKKENFYLDRHTIQTDSSTFIQGFKLNSSYDNLNSSNQANLQYSYRQCKLMDIDKQIKNYEAQIKKYKDEYDVNIPKKIKDVDAELTQLKDDSTKLNQQIKSLNESIDILTRKIEKERSRRRENRNKVTKLTTKLNDSRTKIEKSNKTKDDLEKQRSDYRIKIQTEERLLNSLKNF